MLALPLAERSLRAPRPPSMRPLIPPMAASQSPDPAAREKQSPELASVSRTQSVVPGAATEQFSAERAWNRPEYRRKREQRGLHSLACRRLRAYCLKAQLPKYWQRAQKRSASQLQLRRPSRWGAAVQPSHHDTFPSIHAVLFAAEWRAKHLRVGKCGTNQSLAFARSSEPSQMHWTRTFHHGPGRCAHAGPRLPQPSWNAFSSLQLPPLAGCRESLCFSLPALVLNR